MYPPMGHPSQQTGYAGLGTLCLHLQQSHCGWLSILSNVLFFIILREDLFGIYLFLGWVRTISPISALKFKKSDLRLVAQKFLLLVSLGRSTPGRLRR
jgi:hypothetical protein